ncbi:MBL fold metallo-hydrolase [Thioalkalivibrio sp. ALE19]|uniref:MBL fold metallo-hydrolase n=1 Tax=Thioalkalivibrio sp. ALE19 TaxID=1266909 RepID=UPI0003F53842|nr:MBL fold metallo-hydrolase [Thioalkalivibrio sp. ALE19]
MPRPRFSTLSAAVALALFAGSANASMNATALAVGQGDAMLFEADGQTVMIDTGRSRYDAVNHLHDAGIDRVDLLVATHAHADHIGGAAAILEQTDVGAVWYNGQTHTTQTFESFIDALVEAEDTRYIEPQRGRTKNLGNIEITALHPEGSAADYNGHLHDENIVVRIDYGPCSAVVTGDTEHPGEAEILRAGMDLDADLLELGHHGSSTSSRPEFLEAVDPVIAIAQYGADNQYGHPHDEVIANVERHTDAQFFGTADREIRMQCDPREHRWSIEGGVRPDEPETAGSPAPPSGGGGARSTPSGGCIDLNSVSQNRLQDIIHIGPARSEQIIEGRPWNSLDELTEFWRVGPEEIADMRDQGKACVD